MNEVEALHHFDQYQGIICAIFSEDGLIIYGNDRFNRLLKNSRGSSMYKFIDPKDARKWEEVIEQCRLNPGKLYACSVMIFCTGHVWERISFEIYCRNDKFGLVGYKIPKESIKVDHVDKLEEQLREIAYIQSHEFRAPVARILGISQMSIESNDIQELKNYSLLIRKDAEQLDEFIRIITGKTKTQERDNESRK